MLKFLIARKLKLKKKKVIKMGYKNIDIKRGLKILTCRINKKLLSVFPHYSRFVFDQ
jgi:hypothetical protein